MVVVAAVVVVEKILCVTGGVVCVDDNSWTSGKEGWVAIPHIPGELVLVLLVVVRARRT